MSNLTELKQAMKRFEAGWSFSDTTRARDLLRSEFKDAPCTAEKIQEMLDLLIPKFGNDKTEIERVILAHFGIRTG